MTKSNDHEGGRYKIRFLRQGFESSIDATIPTADKKLRILVVLALHAGLQVSRQTLKHVMYDGQWSDASDNAVDTPLSRLRKPDGWPIEPSRRSLSVAPDDIDILDFNARAKRVLDRSVDVSRLDDDTVEELINEARGLDDLWATDPAEPFRDMPAVAALFKPFAERRDKLVARRRELEHELSRRREPGSTGQADSKLLSQYLVDIQRRGATLSFGNPTSWAATEPADEVITLYDLWTPLRVDDAMQRSGNVGTHESMAERDFGRDLLDLAESTTDPLVLLGEPGGGKSTSVAMLAARAARRWPAGPLPIWVNLGMAATDARKGVEEVLLSGVPELDVALSRGGRHAWADLVAELEGALASGAALLLLDGLDEVKEHSLKTVLKAITTLVRQPGGPRVIVTCRSFDYRHTEPNRKVPINRELQILPLNAAEKTVYINSWYSAAARAGGFKPATAEKLQAALQLELRLKPVISEMAELPLLLALLTLIHSQQELPDSRSVVCDKAIKFMLAETPPWREREPGAAVEATGPVVRLAVEVAFRVHEAEERATDETAVITRELILAEAVKLVEAIKKAAGPRTEHTVPSAEQLTGQFTNSHGLLLEFAPNSYRFAHRYFQEYLAGQHYARGREHPQAVRRGASVHWREPFRLMASFAGYAGDNLETILRLVDDCLASDDIPAMHLAAEMLAEISKPRLALWGFEEATDDDTEPPSLWKRARTKLASHIENPSVALPDRERAGEAIAQLGDYRFEHQDGTSRGAWASLVPVKAGDRRIGTERIDVSTVLGGFVGPPRRVLLSPYQVGKFLVTNADYRSFIDDGGYLNTDLWVAPRARGWLEGDAQTLAEIRAHWLQTVYEHHAKEIRDREIDPERLEVEAQRRTAPRTAPYYWQDSRFNRPNQPVVGVNYWEAEAFCAWATTRAREFGVLEPDYVLAVPTEFEWENAARQDDDDRIFPWGDEWSDARALVTTSPLNLRRPATVGVHLEPWPGGPVDMAGNVWEWTSSLFLPYEAKYDHLRADVNSLNERVVRGGSWYNFAPLTACSARAVDRSYNLFYDVGFRIAAVRADTRTARLS